MASLRSPFLQRLSKWESGKEKGMLSLVGFGENSEGLPALVGTMGIGGFKLQGITTFSIVKTSKAFTFFDFPLSKSTFLVQGWI